MRQLLILTEFPPRIGGMQTHAHYLSRGLAQRGHEIEVLTYQPLQEHPPELVRRVDQALPFPVHRTLSRLAHAHNLRQIVAHAARMRPALLYSSTVFYGRAACQAGLPMMSRCVGNDVLRPWIVYPYSPLSALLSHPAIEEPLHRAFRRLTYPEPVEALYRAARLAVMRDSVLRQRCVLANSDYTRQLLLALGLAPERVQVVVGGVDHSRFSQAPRDQTRQQTRAALGLSPQATLMMTACRLVAKKGIDLLIRAMPALRAVCPTLHLLIVGDGPHRQRLKAMVERLGQGDRVTLLGAVAHDQIHALYAASDLFVLASRVHQDARTGLIDAETMGRVLCEANAAGLPVLAARSGGIPSVITHEVNGLLFEPDQIPSLVHALKRMLSDSALRAALVERGRRQARERFDWSAILDAHEEHAQRSVWAHRRAWGKRSP